ncbi:MAG: porin family protein [Fulvimarina manganoxydans]|uniref:outer membrane protein n=1 Tax=Fulvimarina manganoxydans TaxID=937218 RepID=UPI0023524E14|nr:outer membrane beta-barrel protein [Fulvimarina manganoxydans]MCK5932177.1 porin family protein [Fulvimarina manganoxydans]
MLLRKLAVIAASSMMSTSIGASAADLVIPEQSPQEPIAIVEPEGTWSGLYIGGQGGAAFGRDSADILFDPTPMSATTVYGSDNSKAGFSGGARIGYDYQIGDVVFGALTDISLMTGSTDQRFSVGGVDFTTKDRIAYLGTVRGRIGYAFDDLLVYGTGGFAYAGRSQSTSVSGPFGGSFSESRDKFDTGYTVGGGIEYLIDPHVSLGLEYLYTDLGKSDWSATGRNAAGAVDFNAKTNDRTDFSTLWATISYRFD